MSHKDNTTAQSWGP